MLLSSEAMLAASEFTATSEGFGIENQYGSSQSSHQGFSESIWGGDWVMPTVAEFQALKNNTTSVWTDDYNNTGVKGHVFTNKSDASKSIFLPAAGCIYKSVFTGILHSTDETRDNGYYWSSSLRTDYSPYAYFFRFELWRKAGYSLPSVVLAPESTDRFYGKTVRPVLRVAK